MERRSEIFLAMINIVEDNINAVNDTNRASQNNLAHRRLNKILLKIFVPFVPRINKANIKIDRRRAAR